MNNNHKYIHDDSKFKPQHMNFCIQRIECHVKMQEFPKVTFTFLRYSFGSKWPLKRCKEDVIRYKSCKNYQRENDIILSTWKGIRKIFSLKILIAVLHLEIINQRVWVKLKGRGGLKQLDSVHDWINACTWLVYIFVRG